MSVSKEKLAADSRDVLISVAKKIFAQKGLDGTTVKDLADAANLNVSLISYYFGGKEGLYREVVEGFGRDRLSVVHRILTAPDSLEDFRVKIRLWAEQFLEAHVLESDVAMIIHRDICFKTEGSPMRAIFKDVFLKQFNCLQDFLKAGQTKGFLRDDFDVMMGAGFLFGSLVSSATRGEEAMKEFFGKSVRDQKHRTKIADELISIFIRGTIRN